MTRFSITVDSELLEEARRLAQARTKREVIEQALREFVVRRRLKELEGLVGSGLVGMDLDELHQWRESTTAESR
ncbi:MAG: type II toxin-antitoxin system VapB family antitoxin [Acidobacteria bacterium]|nr:MAG: type II toxin-antitoxin system VapB family antitoxin [Acidobacteriota bacterium]